MFTRIRTHERQLANPDFVQVNYTRIGTSNSSQNFCGSQSPHSSTNVTNSTSGTNKKKGKGPNSNFSQVQCQICKKMGHDSSKCYFKYTQSKNSRSTNNNTKQKGSDSSKEHRAHFSQVQTKDTFHEQESSFTVFPPRNNASKNVQPRAFMAHLTTSSLYDLHWYMDTGATHHLTSNKDQLQHSSAHFCDVLVMLGMDPLFLSLI